MRKSSVVFFAMFLCAFLPLTKQVHAQSAPNAVFLELGGNGILYTVNYDRHFTPDMGIRVGFGYLGLGASSTADASGNIQSVSASFLIIPVLFNYFVGTGSSRLELGVGIDYVSLSASTSGSVGSAFGSGSGVAGTAAIGYRYQPADGGLLFRADFTPMFGSGGFLPWAGISVGYAF